MGGRDDGYYGPSEKDLLKGTVLLVVLVVLGIGIAVVAAITGGF